MVMNASTLTISHLRLVLLYSYFFLHIISQLHISILFPRHETRLFSFTTHPPSRSPFHN
ncbi:hypothetical protein BDR03DRAFT_953844 [Suillus americanus]|nr:hypothetical protein BDR03DRAFT_953844 [Suillus americanus]